MKEKWHLLTIVLIAGVFVFAENILAAGRNPMTAAELALYKGPDRRQLLEDGAKKEGTLLFYTSGVMKGALGDSINLFKKKYPFINVDIWRASTSQLAARLREEHIAGKYVADAIAGVQSAQLMFREAGVLQPFYSPGLANIEEGLITNAPSGGVLSACFRLHGIGVGYNTKLITKGELPKTYQDLLNSKWNGKIPITDSGTSVDWMGGVLKTHGEEFVKKLAQQNFAVHAISAMALLDLIISGEYLFSPAMFESQVMNSNKKGAPVDWVPLEPVAVHMTQVALVKHSPHPHAAMLFIDFHFSKEMGEIQKADGYVPAHKDLPVERSYKKFYGATSLKETMEWNKIFSKLFVKR